MRYSKLSAIWVREWERTRSHVSLCVPTPTVVAENNVSLLGTYGIEYIIHLYSVFSGALHPFFFTPTFLRIPLFLCVPSPHSLSPWGVLCFFEGVYREFPFFFLSLFLLV